MYAQHPRCPILMNIGNLLYVLVALAGGICSWRWGCRTSPSPARRYPSAVVGTVPQHDQAVLAAQIGQISHADQRRGHGPGRRASASSSSWTSSPRRTTATSPWSTPSATEQRQHRPRPTSAPAYGPGSTPTRRRHRHLHASCRATFAMDRRGLRLHAARKTVLHDVTSVREARPEDRLRGRHRRGQDDHHQPHQPLLRHRRRQDPLRRHQHQQDQEGGPAPLAWASCLQDTNLFTGTVMDNIRYGKPGRHRRGVHRRGQAGQRRTTSSPVCRRATTRCSPATAPTFPRASGS